MKTYTVVIPIDRYPRFSITFPAIKAETEVAAAFEAAMAIQRLDKGWYSQPDEVVTVTENPVDEVQDGH